VEPSVKIRRIVAGLVVYCLATHLYYAIFYGAYTVASVYWEISKWSVGQGITWDIYGVFIGLWSSAVYYVLSLRRKLRGMSVLILLAILLYIHLQLSYETYPIKTLASIALMLLSALMSVFIVRWLVEWEIRRN
jgi:hypothetical protein